MDNYTQLGVAGITLAIIFFIVRYFVQAMTKKDEVIINQHKDLKDILIKNIESTDKFTDVITLNTAVVKSTADIAQKTAVVSKKTSDTLTRLITKTLRDNNI